MSVSIPDNQDQTVGAVAGRSTSGGSDPLLAMVQATAKLVMASLAPQTLASYNRNLLHFRHFLLMLCPRYDPFPANPGHISLYVTHLYTFGMAPSTIATKLSSIAFVHKLYNKQDPTSSFIVTKLMSSLRKANPQKDMRLPITIDMLQIILNNLHRLGFTQYQRLLLKSMLTLKVILVSQVFVLMEKPTALYSP